jgi:transcription factor CRZ1
LYLKRLRSYPRQQPSRSKEVPVDIMDQQRGRSPSAGQQPHINHTHSPSPQQYQDNTNTAGLGLGLDASLDHQYSNSSYPQSQGLPAYNDVFLTSQQSQQYTQGGVVDPIFAQTQNFNQQFKQEDLSPNNQPSLSPYNQQQQPTFS